MKTLKRISCATIALGMLSSSVQAQDPGTATSWDRYSIILTRAPFGTAPAKPVEPAAPQLTPAELNFAKEMRVAFIRRKNDGTLRVGIVDNAAKPPWQAIMEVGETENGLTLVSADYEKSKALVQKGSVSQEIFTSGQSGPASTVAKSGSAPAPRSPQSVTRVSYTERSRQRREAWAKAEQERIKAAPMMQGEELNSHLKNYQMDLIRSGGEMGPPLPMQLTQEMDDQLVAEGVLQPTQ